jgi:hypothetical protein
VGPPPPTVPTAPPARPAGAPPPVGAPPGAGDQGQPLVPLEPEGRPDPFSTIEVPAAPRESLAARIRMARRPQIERPLLISHGYGLGDSTRATGSPEMPPDAMMALSPADLQRIADDLVTALTANHAAEVAAARQDQRWDAHLGRSIREAWSDYQACVGGSPEGEEHFRAALNRILAQGQAIF